jgi:valyl-tRNA synthetase
MTAYMFEAGARGIGLDNTENEEIQKKWISYWENSGIFKFNTSDKEKPLFVIDTPPPFTNGKLHMGQTFWVCYVDAIARYRNMSGYNVLYPVGWDTHGFATELAVEKQYGKGLSRDDFYSKCLELSMANIKAMKDMMKMLGATFDGSLEYTTTSKDYVSKVQWSLVEMHKKGLVYLGVHPVEWCTRCVSGISREETEEREEESMLHHIEFKMETPAGAAAGNGLIIATSRPEMLHACVAIAVNGSDSRYSGLVGMSVKTPIYGKIVKIIADDGVDKEFGTGAEMICTFGDKADISMFYRHKLSLIEAIDDKGALVNAGELNGKSLPEARKLVVEMLSREGALRKSEKIKHTVKVHDRDGCPIELISSKQWFLKIKESADDIKSAAHEIKWIPENTRQRLDDWANFIEWDWNISRNRVFGTPIPFWRCEKCDNIIAPSKEMLPVDTLKNRPKEERCQKCGGGIVGTPDTADVWIDSSITPMIIAGWPDNKELFSRAFPAAVRIQGTDIVRTWAFYTVYRTLMLTGNKPFESILAHGLILGTDGREMHKRFGNGIMPDELMEKYPVDAIRLWVALSGALGKDKPFSYAEMDYAKSFLTKFKNTVAFVELALKKGRLPENEEEPSENFSVFDIWILNRLNSTVKEVTDAYDSYSLHAAMGAAISFYWHEFADYYIENIKHRIYTEDKSDAAEASKSAALFTLKYVVYGALRIFAPVIPFTCEELNSRFTEKSIFSMKFPKYSDRESPSDYVINGLVFKSALVDVEPDSVAAMLNNIISQVRRAKATARLALNKEIASININVPEQYYKAVAASQEDLKRILKAVKIELKGSEELSVSITV